MSDEMLAMLYATYIMRGKIEFSSVPEQLKPQVEQILIDEGLEELAK